MQALRNTHKRNRPGNRPGHSAMNALTDPPPPPLIFSTKHDRKKEGDKTKDGANICRPKARGGLQLVLSKQKEEIQSLQAELDKSKAPSKAELDKKASPSYAKGGRVKTTGKATVHKDEIVLPVSLVKQLKKLMK